MSSGTTLARHVPHQQIAPFTAPLLHPPDVAQRIVASFNSWRFKREQPSTPASLDNAVAYAVARRCPVPFVMYWGKGPRHHITNHETTTLAFLASMMARIREQYAPGVEVTLITTDTHAGLNGHAPSAMAAYFWDVAEAASAHAFKVINLSEVIRDVRPSDVPTPPMPPELLTSLTRSAEKWHRGGYTPEAAARAYYAQNMIERVAVERHFPNAIFVTYNGSDLRPIFPEHMPIFYMYSTKRGCAVKPWFME